MVYKENVQAMLKRYKSTSSDDAIVVDALTRKITLNKELLRNDQIYLKDFIYSNFDLTSTDYNIRHLLFDKYGDAWNKLMAISDIELFETFLAVCSVLGIININRVDRMNFVSRVGREPDTKNKQCLTEALQKEIRDFIEKYCRNIYEGFSVDIDIDEALKYNPADTLTLDDLREYANEYIFRIEENHTLETIEKAGIYIDKYPEEVIGLISILISSDKPLSEILDYVEQGLMDKKIMDVKRLSANPTIGVKLDRLKRKLAYNYKTERKNNRELEEIKRHL